MATGIVALTACADSGRYPSIGNISKISDASILTPEQRDAAVREMEKERETHDDRAAKEIEKPK
ncbi:MAG: hypothetical protein NW215_10475 [Hyphomicrobiales bacterium]|nr:hypothetical protein [Hyphomicrobiales bacterium]